MKIKSIKKKASEVGVAGAVCYYACRLYTKLEMVLLGTWLQRYGKICESRIVFKNRQGQDFTDNARALFEYLIEKGYNERYQIIWVVSEKAKFKEYNYKNVLFVTAENRYGWTSGRAFYYGNTAKYFFYTNNTADLNRYHCKGQLTINLWHGCGYKGATRDKAEIPRSKTMEYFDYALVPGDVFVKTKSAYWGCKKEKILPLGYPRYDWMLRAGRDRVEILHKLFAWENTDSKVVIWMPTFRKSLLTGYAESKIELPYELPGLKSKEELLKLDEYCHERNILLIIKKHPLQIGWDKPQDFLNIRYVSDGLLRQKEVQLYSLVGICDGLLSDYSSIAVDYILLDCPLGYVMADYEEYAETRGFVFENPLDYMPGEKLYTLCNIKMFLEHVSLGKDLWKEERKRLLPQMHNVTENYCERIVDCIFHMDVAH